MKWHYVSYCSFSQLSQFSTINICNIDFIAYKRRLESTTDQEKKHPRTIEKQILTLKPSGKGSCWIFNMISEVGLRRAMTASWWVYWEISSLLTAKILSPIRNFPDLAAIPSGTIWKFKWKISCWQNNATLKNESKIKPIQNGQNADNAE